VGTGAGTDAGTVAGLLLAAGAGRRYGMPKALVRHGGGLLVDHGIGTLASGGCVPIVVVLGARQADVREQANLSDATVVVNEDWDSGMGSSLRAGLTALESTTAAAAIVLLVDTPGITAAAVERVRSYGRPDALAAATYGGEMGHPVLLGRDHWTGVIATAIGDRGARPYLRQHRNDLALVACEDIADGADMDTPPPGG
jgi:CTP:molybdopterin cytidylyltransferase MocA